MERKRRVTTLRQLELLVSFMRDHKDLALGRVKSKEGRETAKSLMQQLALLLNPEGPRRTEKEWAKIWNDLKSRVKLKIITIRKGIEGTGGGPHANVILTPLEDQVAEIIGRDSGYLPGVNIEGQIQENVENNEGEGRKHEIEENPIKRTIWIERMDRPDIISKKGRHHVCSLHFTKDMFTFSNKRLKSDVLPSLNLPGSETLINSSCSQKSVETQIDKPTIIEIKQIKPPSTVHVSTQVQIACIENETQTIEGVWSNQHLQGPVCAIAVPSAHASQVISVDKSTQATISLIENGTQTTNSIWTNQHLQCQVCGTVVPSAHASQLKTTNNTKTSQMPTQSSVTVQAFRNLDFPHTVQPSKTFFSSIKNRNQTSSKCVQTTKIMTENTPRKRKLKEIIRDKEQTVKKLKKEISTMDRKLNSSIKRKLHDSFKNIDIESENSHEIDQIEQNLNIRDEENKIQGGKKENLIDRFYDWQKKLKSKYKGNRYEKELKLLALNIFFSSPQAYRFLEKIFALPSVRTLQRSKMIFKPGVSEDLIKLLSTRLEKMTPNYKYCILCLDEIMLRKNLYYDIRSDEVIGFHNIDGEKSEEIASHAFVIMLRGCVENYKQSLGYALTATTKNYLDLNRWVDQTILQLFAVGFIVCAVVSDQGSNFVNLARSKGVTTDKPYFIIDGKKVFHLFDVPHLFKSIRNNMLTYDLQYKENKVACWSHVESFYGRDKERNIRMAPKLTDAHLNPNRFQRMKVRYATQTLSHTVASGMLTEIDLGLLPASAKDTVDLIANLNNAFDVLNSSKVFDSNKYKRAFHGAEYQLDCLKNTVNIMESMKAIHPTTKKDNTNKIKAFSGLVQTINAVIQLFDTFKSEGLRFMFTRRVNQDPLENFFGVVRQQSGNTREPTPIQFQRAFSKLVLGYLVKKSSLSNCEEDIDVFLCTEHTKSVFVNQIPPEATPLAIQTNDYRTDLPSQNAFNYVCGYLLKKCSLRHDCPDFILFYFIF